jgi:hypothetical protein
MRGRPGFLLLEIVLGICIFGLFMSAVGLILLYGQQNTSQSGDRVRAAQAAEQGLEASRSIRDGSFAAVTAGTHGFALNASKTWTYSGTKLTVTGSYVTKVTVTSMGTDWVRVGSSVRWKHGVNRSGSVLLTTDLTNWRAQRLTGDWSAATLEGSYTDAGSPQFNSAAVSGNYAFVTSDSSGGAGLYVFDISNTASPSRVASSFNLGADARGVAVKGKVLYVTTADSNQEIRAYSIASPTSLSAANLIATYNLSGSSLATSLALQGDTLLVGATQNASYNELYSFDVSRSGSIVYKGSLPVTGTVNAVSVTGSSAFLATDYAAGKLKRAYIAADKSLSFPTNSDWYVTNTTIGRAVFASGTSALLGGQKSAAQEMVLFDTRDGGGNPAPSPGPWYHEGSGSVVGVTADAGLCYAFLASDSNAKAFQVVQMRDKSLSEIASANATSPSSPGRGIFYDIVRDRVFLLTKKAILIYKPGSGSGPCS